MAGQCYVYTVYELKLSSYPYPYVHTLPSALHTPIPHICLNFCTHVLYLSLIRTYTVFKTRPSVLVFGFLRFTLITVWHMKCNIRVRKSEKGSDHHLSPFSNNYSRCKRIKDQRNLLSLLSLRYPLFRVPVPGTSERTKDKGESFPIAICLGTVL